PHGRGRAILARPARRVRKPPRRGRRRRFPGVSLMRGPPKLYTADRRREIVERVCSLIATQARSLNAICDDPGNEVPVAACTLFQWMLEDDREDEMLRQDFRRMYDHAKEMQAHVAVDEILEIADDARNDYLERVSRNGETTQVFNKESVNRSRLRVDARQWAAKNLLPHRFGDRTRVDQHVSGSVELVGRLEQARAQVEDMRRRRVIEGRRTSPPALSDDSAGSPGSRFGEAVDRGAGDRGDTLCEIEVKGDT